MIKVKLKIKELELEIDGSNDEVPQVAESLRNQVGGLLPSSDIVSVEKCRTA